MRHVHAAIITHHAVLPNVYVHHALCVPSGLCFRCGEPGHMTKDCKLQRGQVKGGRRGLCLRCGRADCTAADYSDWFRCAQATTLQPLLRACALI
jgi:hypothetical protein